jgi:pimeloyl-ACP methyl ester carboxylesterase
MLQTTFQRVRSLYDPLANATLPLLNGLTRRRLLRTGAQEREVRLDGVSLSYYVRGPRGGAVGRTPILLVHGLADSALTWAFVIGPLARDRAVYAVDLPGYGGSGLPPGQPYATLDQMCGLLTRFLREVVGAPALVVGNSMGGWLAIKLARAAEELVRGIVLLDAGGAPLQGRASWEPFREAISVPDLKATRRVMRQMFGAAALPLLVPLGQHGVQSLFQRQVVREFVAVVQEDEFLTPDDLRGLRVPTGLIWGLSDHFLPEGSLEFFREHLPHPQTLLMRHCGHLPQRERPIEVIRFLRAFAARLETMMTHW